MFGLGKTPTPQGHGVDERELARLRLASQQAAAATPDSEGENSGSDDSSDEEFAVRRKPEAPAAPARQRKGRALVATKVARIE